MKLNILWRERELRKLLEKRNELHKQINQLETGKIFFSFIAELEEDQIALDEAHSKLIDLNSKIEKLQAYIERCENMLESEGQNGNI